MITRLSPTLRRLSALAVILVATSTTSSATNVEEIPLSERLYTEEKSDLDLIHALRQLVPAVMRAKGTPGLNIALARRGEMIWEAGFGWANLEEPVAMRPDHVFKSGSMGKTYTGAAIMQLVETGVIELHGPINDYLPFEVTNPFGGRPVTVHDLLTHQSGLTPGDGALSQFEEPRPLRVALDDAYTHDHMRMYERSNLPLWSAQPGERHAYSNLAIATLGLIVEERNPEGLSYSEYVEKHLMRPLGMTSSQYPPAQIEKHIRPDIWKRMTTGYARFGAVYIPTPTVMFEGFTAGGFVSTPADHLRFVLAMMYRGEYGGARILKPETVEQMLSPQLERLEPTTSAAQGLIWFLNDRGRATETFSHGGAHMFGWVNNSVAYPELDAALVMSTNNWSLPTRTKTGSLIPDFVGRWLAMENREGPLRGHAVDWSWKTSYVIGLLFVESLNGFVGIPTQLDDATWESLARRAVMRPGAPNHEAGWSVEAFLTGVRDMQKVPMAKDAIRSFRDGDEIRVSPDEIGTIFEELGGTLVPEQFQFIHYLAPPTRVDG